MKIKRVLSQSIYIIVVLAMITSTMASLAIPNGMVRAAENNLSGMANATSQTQPSSQDQSGVQGVPLLDENFDYGGTPGNLTAVSGGNWLNHSGTSGFVQYITTSLSMPSYVSSGIGGSATHNETGEDVNRSFTEQTNSVVYYAALVNIPLATAGGDYYLHFKNASTGFAGRLYARDSGGALQFGIGTSTTPGPTYSTTNFAYNTTYLVVAKHDQVSGVSTLYVLDTCVSTEPVTPLATATGTALASISAIAIRQSTSTPDGTVDGIRVATNWASAAMCTTGWMLTSPLITLFRWVTVSE
jgi:hypothetical protein